MRTRCKICHKQVIDAAFYKWRHVLKAHPEMLLEHALVAFPNPEKAREAGAYAADWLKARLGVRR